MKVAIIMDALAMGGAERQAVLAAAELARRGLYAELIYYHPINEYQELAAAQGARLVGIFDRGPLRLGRLRALSRHLRQGGFDVVHAFQKTSSIWGALAALRAATPCVFGGYRGQIREPLVARTLLKFLSGRLAGWIVNAECVRRFLADMLALDPARIHVVHNALCPDSYQSSLTRAEARAKFGLTDGTVAATLVANLRPVKNHAMLLRVARRVCDVRDDVVFLVAGQGPLRAGLEADVRAMGLAGRVTFLGQRADVPDLLAASDLALLTSITEGLPNVLAEAGGAGLPAVSTDCGGAGDVLVDGTTGYVVPVNDDAAMAQRILQLAGDPQARSRMGQAARQHVRGHLSCQAMGDRLVALYERGLRGELEPPA
jgi:glycosyltransferase involved in cell wall biosynthesis